MQKIIQFIMLLILSSSLSLWAGTDIQNGGGGIIINGKVATFYGAELQISPEPIKESPAMTQLDFLIRNLPIPGRVRVELMENIIPSFSRTYYSVTKESVDVNVLNNLKEQYHKVTNIPVESLTIFALTDPKTRVTLLLPDYDNLDDEERVAILLHESLWLNNRVDGYERMLQIERSAQVYMNYPRDCQSLTEFITNLESIFQENSWGINAAFKCEIAKYIDYSKGLPPIVPLVDFSDLLDTKAMDSLVELMLDSEFGIKQDPALINLFIQQLKSTTSSRIFLSSKTALIQDLQKGAKLEANIDSNLRMRIANTNNPTAKENIQILKTFLMNTKFYLGDNPKFDGFKLMFMNSVGSIYLNYGNKE